MIFFWHCGVAFFINTFIIIIVLKYKTLREKEFVYFFILSLSLSLPSRLFLYFYVLFSNYALDLLQRTNISNAKPFSSPAASDKKFAIFDGDPLPDPTEYHTVVGASQYLT